MDTVVESRLASLSGRFTSYATPIHQKATCRFVIDFCSNEILHGEIEQKFERDSRKERNLFSIYHYFNELGV